MDFTQKTSDERLDFFQRAVKHLRKQKIFQKVIAEKIGMDEKRMTNMMSSKPLVRPSQDEIDALFETYRVKLRSFKHPLLVDPEVLPPAEVEKNTMEIIRQQNEELARTKAELKRLKDYIRKGGDLID